MLNMIDLINDKTGDIWKGHIEYFAVSKRSIFVISDQSVDCMQVIIKINDKLLLVEFVENIDGENTFEVDYLQEYDQNEFYYRVKSKPDESIIFLNELREPDGTLTGVKFQYGNRFLFLFSSSLGLTLTKSIIDLEDFSVNELPDYDDSVLFD